MVGGVCVPVTPESRLERPTVTSSWLKSSWRPMSIWMAATSRDDEKATTTYMPSHVGNAVGTRSQRTCRTRKQDMVRPTNKAEGGAWRWWQRQCAAFVRSGEECVEGWAWGVRGGLGMGSAWLAWAWGVRGGLGMERLMGEIEAVHKP
jgi:hypothetical protein